MSLTSVDLDPLLLRKAKELTGAKSNRAVLDLALRRLIASRQKTSMVEGIAALADNRVSTDSDVPVSDDRHTPAP